jgi:kinesin family protein 13
MEEAKKKELEEANKEKKLAEHIKKVPHLVNLNEDPMLDRKIVYDLTITSQVHIGRKNGDPAPSIVLGGIGI